MTKFVIQPHGRLHEAVAHELGYFTEEGLDYELSDVESFGLPKVDLQRDENGEVRRGAFEAYVAGGGNKGQKSDISCACHWAVNQASASDVGHLYSQAYVVSPGAIMVPEDSDIRRPEDLAGKEVAVGYHSGSHFTTLQALEPFLKPDDINLKFVGTPWARVDAGLDGSVAATSVWGITFQAAEQLGLRRVADCTFMIAFMFPHETNKEDVDKYMSAMKRAQMEIDLFPEKYKHFYAPQIPERYKDKLDVRLFSPGERIVFLPYTEETFARTQDWIHERGIFDTRPEYTYAAAVGG